MTPRMGGSPPPIAPWGGGSVSRCDANQSVPSRQSPAAAVTPAAGWTWVASTVTTAGPTM